MRAAAEVAAGGPALLVPCLQPAMRAGPCRPVGRNTMRHGVHAAWCPVVGCTVPSACTSHVACRMVYAACCVLHAAPLHVAKGLLHACCMLHAACGKL